MGEPSSKLDEPPSTLGELDGGPCGEGDLALTEGARAAALGPCGEGDPALTEGARAATLGPCGEGDPALTEAALADDALKREATT